MSTRRHAVFLSSASQDAVAPHRGLTALPTVRRRFRSSTLHTHGLVPARNSAMRTPALVICLGTFLGAAIAAPLKPDLTRLRDPGATVTVEQAEASVGADGSLRLAVAGQPVQTGSRAGLLWIKGVDFREGSIEVELKGRGAPPQHSFLGVAFHGIDARTFEGVYFRPFNFKAPEPQRLRSVQYISWPEHTWEKLRREHPGAFEKPVVPTPDPDGWFHVRVDVSAREVRVFVDRAREPTLVVERLTSRATGKVGLLVDVYDGQFRNLVIDPR